MLRDIQPTVTAMSIESVHLGKLLAWTSPGYPTGAFSYSHGLEQAVEDRLVAGPDELFEFIAASLERGCAFIDAVMFACAWRAASDPEQLSEIADEAAAWRATSELALESRQQGAAFLAVTRKAWPHPSLEAFAASRAGQAMPHSVVVAVACAAHGIPLRQALEAYLHGFAANLVSAGVRLVPLGQTDGQTALSRLAAIIPEIADRAIATQREELGSNAFALDLLSMRHETQYTRLFRS
jgi:urease accessory protein